MFQDGLDSEMGVLHTDLILYWKCKDPPKSLYVSVGIDINWKDIFVIYQWFSAL